MSDDTDGLTQAEGYVLRDLLYDAAAGKWFFCGLVDLTTGGILAHFTLAEAQAVDLDMARLCDVALLDRLERGEVEVFAAPQVPERYRPTCDMTLIVSVEESYNARPGTAHTVALRGKKHQGQTTVKYDPVDTPLFEYEGRRWLGTSGSWGLLSASGDHDTKTQAWLTLKTHTLEEVVSVESAAEMRLTPRRPEVNELRFAGQLFDWQPPTGAGQALVLTGCEVTLVEPVQVHVRQAKDTRPRQGGAHRTRDASASEPAVAYRQAALF